MYTAGAAPVCWLRRANAGDAVADAALDGSPDGPDDGLADGPADGSADGSVVGVDASAVHGSVASAEMSPVVKVNVWVEGSLTAGISTNTSQPSAVGVVTWQAG